MQENLEAAQREELIESTLFRLSQGGIDADYLAELFDRIKNRDNTKKESNPFYFQRAHRSLLQGALADK
ncbi:MAG: hypothetical protein ACM3KS_00255 [Phycisphaerales bacterium]